MAQHRALREVLPGLRTGEPYGLDLANEVLTTSTLATANIADLGVTAAKLAADAVTTAKILDANVTTAKLAANAVTSAKIDKMVMQLAIVSLSAANITSLNTVPVDCVAAPGAGRVLVVQEVALAFDYGTVQFTGGGVVTVNYAGGAAAINSIAAAVIQAAADSYTSRKGIDVTAVANTKLVVQAATADFAAGDSTAKLYIWYRDISLDGT